MVVNKWQRIRRNVAQAVWHTAKQVGVGVTIVIAGSAIVVLGLVAYGKIVAYAAGVQ